MRANQQSNVYLVILVFAQFAGTSLWFAGNAIIDRVTSSANHAAITSFVQFGFIAGTLAFSVFTIADRFSPRTIFFLSGLLAAAVNLSILWLYRDLAMLKLLRFLTGFFLAGIYPVGMKIAANLFPQRVGKALGFLVGALVLGTAFPHFVRSQVNLLQWEPVIIATSILAFCGALVILLIPEPKWSSIVQKPDVAAAFRLFQNRAFRSAAFGYFGHMWELYAFWSILPVLFSYRNAIQHEQVNIFWWSFLVISTGAAGCVLGGLLSQTWGSRKVACLALASSGLCCVVSPFFFTLPPLLFYSLIMFWGLMVTPDSPQFSALVAATAEEKYKGTALTIVTCIGFAITIFSILLLKACFEWIQGSSLWLLAPGPLLGLIALQKRNET